MSTLQARSKNTLLIAASIVVGLLVVASLPALGVAAVVLRAVLFGIAVVALVVGAVAYLFSPGFRRWWAAKLDTQPSYKGLRLRDGVRLDDGHSWSRRRGNDYAVGVDDLTQRILGPLDAVDLPGPGSYFERGDTLLELHSGKRSIRLRAPFSGIVRRCNESLLYEPQRINRDPYGDGWTLEIEPIQPDEIDRLHRGSGARSWYCSEVDRLIRVIAPATSPLMADGGALIDELHRALDAPTWARVRQSFFENPGRE